MVVVVILIALLQVFVLNQLVFWVAWPCAWLLFCLVFVREAQWHELLRWAAVYVMVSGIFLESNQIQYWLAVLVSTGAVIASQQLFMRLRSVKSHHFVIVAIQTVLFSALYVGIVSLGHTTEISQRAIATWLLGMVAINMAIGLIAVQMAGSVQRVRA